METRPGLTLDHLAVAGESLEAARAYVEEALGVPLQPGGKHDVFFTHNALLGLEDELYLEAISIDPDAPAPERRRWFDLDSFVGPPRLTNWICRSPDLDQVLAALPLNLGAPVDLRRGALSWRMAVPADGRLPFENCAPALIQWQGDGHPCDVLAQQGVKLRRLVVSHPQAPDLADALAPYLDDARIAFETGSVGLWAGFETPQGERYLEG